MPILRTILYGLMITSIFGVALPYLIISGPWKYPLDLGYFSVLGFLPLLLGMAGCYWCAMDFSTVGQGTPAPFDPPKKLVLQGLYRYCRNPMFASFLLLMVGEAVLLSSLSVLAYTAVLAVVMHLFITRYEEPNLMRKFGQPYADYLARSSRWIPRRSKPDGS